MAVLSLNEILELREIVKPHGYKIRLHDACGGQSFTLEPDGNEQDGQVYRAIEAYLFSHKTIATYYGEDRLNFTIR